VGYFLFEQIGVSHPSVAAGRAARSSCSTLILSQPPDIGIDLFSKSNFTGGDVFFQ
jgi:hypothetical protein